MEIYSTGSKDLLAGNDAVQPAGRVTKVTGLVMEAVGLRLPVGSACSVFSWAVRKSKQKLSASMEQAVPDAP
jgi:flagellar biosynthesis/type III secretory pathway ATPase